MSTGAAAVEEAKALLPIILKQEETIHYSSFTSNDALALGLAILNRLQQRTDKKPGVISISMGGRTVFKFAMDGTPPDNWHWITRKEATVYRFHHSSYYMGRYLASQQTTIEQKYFVSEREYASHGGAFPLIINGLGVVGVVAVSGLPQAEDHQLVVDAMEDYMCKVGQHH